MRSKPVREKGSIPAEVDLIVFDLARRHYPDKIKKPTDLALNPDVLDLLYAKADHRTEGFRLAQRRATGRPLQHILGYQFFFEHEYIVTPDVLIPRPETEILIDSFLKKFTPPASGEFRFAELGLGSGIISAEILNYYPKAKGVATEAHFPAIEVSIKNLAQVVGKSFMERLKITLAPSPETGFEIFLEDGPFDVVFSNPPYVAKTDRIEGEVRRHEPHIALFPPKEDPNYFYKNFCTHAPKILKRGGVALFELPHERALDIGTFFKDQHHFSQVETLLDLNQRPRILWVVF